MIIITKCGHDSKHKTKCNILRKTGNPDYLLLFIKTAAFIEINGQIIDTKPDLAILFNRNSYIHYGCEQNNFNDDWIHFDFVDEPSLLESLNIPFNTPVYLPCITHLSNYVRLLVQESHTAAKYKDQIQDCLMRTILYSLDSQINFSKTPIHNHKYFSIMNELRTSIHNSPHKKWSVDIMADFVHMSPSYFQHLYKELFGISCKQEVIKVRLDNAKFYLNTTDMSIQALANFCGYDNELHFMRQFKKFEGVTPSQYREIFRDKNNMSPL